MIIISGAGWTFVVFQHYQQNSIEKVSKQVHENSKSRELPDHLRTRKERKNDGLKGMEEAKREKSECGFFISFLMRFEIRIIIIIGRPPDGLCEFSSIWGHREPSGWQGSDWFCGRWSRWGSWCSWPSRCWTSQGRFGGFAAGGWTPEMNTSIQNCSGAKWSFLQVHRLCGERCRRRRRPWRGRRWRTGWWRWLRDGSDGLQRWWRHEQRLEKVDRWLWSLRTSKSSGSRRLCFLKAVRSYDLPTLKQPQRRSFA